MNIRKERISVFGMTCASCEARVERAVKKLSGVMNAKASYSKQFVDVEYDSSFCSTEKIKSAVKAAGYTTTPSLNFKIVGIIIIALAIMMLSSSTQGFDMSARLNNASYFVLFIIGVLTSIHCVGMCGGILLSQSVNKDSVGESTGVLGKLEAIRPAFLYNFGRVISYTILGGLVGALGSVFSLSTEMQAGLQIFAAIFMIIMGLNMSGFETFRKLHIQLPWSTCSIKKKNNGPLVVGLLNGFMPCGPLQTMQLYALGTGSAVKGALAMFIFSLGTVPLMLAFGAASGFLSKNYTKMLLKFGGIFIVVLGLIMGQRGLALAGVNLNPMVALTNSSTTTSKPTADSIATMEEGVQVIKMSAEGRGYLPKALYIQKGVPVKWIIDGKQITSCNNEIVVSSLKIRKKLKSGENVIEFTPKETGDINFSCWMGMIRGVFKVVDDIGALDASKVAASTATDATAEEPVDSCCAVGTEAGASSIYGADLSTVATATLVKKSSVAGNTQSYTFKGIGYEFDPLILVVNKGVKTTLTFDLKEFENPDGEFTLIDGDSGDTITTFKGSNNTAKLDYTFKKATGYGIVKDGIVISVIESVDDIKKADIEKIRKKYLE